MAEDMAEPQDAPKPPVTAALADFVSGLRLDDLPGDVALAGSCCLLDWLGCTIAGNQDRATLPFRDYVSAESSSDVASVLGTGLRSSAEGAALANGAATHVHDFDDTHLGMYGHPSAATIAATMAVAEREDADGTALLAAVVAGVETTCRLGTMLGYDVYRKGFTPASQSGVLGAAGAAARLCNGTHEHVLGALSLAAGLASGLHCNGRTGAGLLQIGSAAASGVRAADLARLGATSLPDTIECDKGLVLSRTGQPNWDGTIGSPDRPFEILRMMFKFHAACGGAQAAIDAALQLRADGLSHEKVDRIEITVSPTVARLCRFGVPENATEAKLSLPFAIAAGLLAGRTADEEFYGDATLRDPAMQQVMQRVEIISDPDISEWETRLIAVDLQGRAWSRAVSADIPTEDWQALWQRLSTKFSVLIGPIVGAAAADTVIARVRERAPARQLIAAIN